MQLPGAIKTIRQERGRESEPQLVVRALNSLSGDLGEVYAFVEDQKLELFSRGMGAGFDETCHSLSELRQISVEEDRPFAYLHFAAGDQQYTLKYSGMDLNNIKALAAALRSGREASEPAQMAAKTPPTLPPNVIQSAISPVDDEVELTPIIRLLRFHLRHDSVRLQHRRRRARTPERDDQSSADDPQRARCPAAAWSGRALSTRQRTAHRTAEALPHGQSR